MTLDPFVIESFGGLNVRDDPQEFGFAAAQDLLDVSFDLPGRVRCRDGYASFVNVGFAHTPDSLGVFYPSVGPRMVVGNGGRLDAVNSSGSIVRSAFTLGSEHTFAAYGSPGSSLLLMGNGTDPLIQYDGTTFLTVVFTDQVANGKLLAVQTTDNRVVNGPFGDDSTLIFSDAADPTTFAANNYVRLTPGDGQPIKALVSWRELLIAFKEDKFFVFYGNSTDSGGNPVFNYRTVDTGVGCVGMRAIAVAPEGVYFISRSGVYLTSGGPPQKVSDTLDPWFQASTGYINQSAIGKAAMTYSNGRLHVAVPTLSSSTNDRMLVLFPGVGWSVWSIAASSLVPFRVNGTEYLTWGYATQNAVARQFVNQDDSGTTITSRYLTGWSDLKAPASEKTIRETLVTGTGTVSFGWATDHGVVTRDRTLVFPMSPTKKRYDQAFKGELFAFSLTGSFTFQATGPGPWGVSRLVPMVREVGPVGLMS